MKITFHAAGHRGQLWESKSKSAASFTAAPAEMQSPPGHHRSPCPCTAQVIRLNLLVHKRLYKDGTRPHF